MRAILATMVSISSTSIRLLRIVVRQQPLARAGFVDDVDGLVGQQAVADVLDRQVDRGLQRLVGVGHAVVRLVLAA